MFTHNIPALLLIVVIFSNVCITQTPYAADIATVKYELPEFRDASAWRGRYGLTLFSPDGKLFAFSGKSADVIIVDTASGAVRSEIHGQGFSAFSFGPDAKFAAAREKSNLGLKIFETETGKQLMEIRGLDKAIKIGKFLGGPGLFGSLYGDSLATPYEMNRVPVSPDWKNILVNKNDREFEIYDFKTGSFKYELEHDKYSRSGQVTRLIYAFLGITAGVATGFLYTGSTSSAQFSSDGKFVLIANGNKNPTIWNTETGQLAVKFESKEKIFIVRLSPNGKMVATSDISGITRVWDAGSGNEISSFGSKKEPNIISAWNRDGRLIFTIGMNKGDIRAFEAGSGRQLYSFEKSNSRVLLQSDDGRFIATAPRNGKSIFFQIWEADTGNLIATVPRGKNKKPPFVLKWNPNSKMLVSARDLKDEVELWNLKGEHVQILQNASFPMQFSPDGKLLLTGGKAFDGKNEIDVGYLWELSGN